MNDKKKPMKSLNSCIKNILANPDSNDFILADAKDADMAFGLSCTGSEVDGKQPSLASYRQKIRDVVEQGLVDIVIMSPSNSEILAQDEGIFNDTAITPAARANDATDIWSARGSNYASEPSRPFRTASLSHVMNGSRKVPKDNRFSGADLGLYSMTFNNDLEADYNSLMAYNDFRHEAEKKGFRHFLEVFAPNMPNVFPKPFARPVNVHPLQAVGDFINDNIARALAGVTKSQRPIFLKIPYCGPKAMEELVAYDPTLIPGILGGASGTTMDAFTLLAEAKKYGARAALFGRKINNAEDQLLMIQYLRRIADGDINAAEATKAYHAALKEKSITPYRNWGEDSKITAPELAYLK